MKVGIIGAGSVGASCAKSMLLRGSCQEIYLLDLDASRTNGVYNDLSHGGVLCPRTRITPVYDYPSMKDAGILVITAGINEKAGNATDRKDDKGRLRLIPQNAKIYEGIIKKIKKLLPEAIVLVVTDPPDPLAQYAREKLETNPVISSGTYLDSLRFRFQIGRHLKCDPSSVNAFVIGEHGTSQVYLWSSATIGGKSVLEIAAENGQDPNHFRSIVESDVRHANITIIEGTGASQHGIGIVTARIVEAILRDEGLVEPVGIYHPKYAVTLSLPSVIDAGGVSKVIDIRVSEEEERALAYSAEFLSIAYKQLQKSLRR